MAGQAEAQFTDADIRRFKRQAAKAAVAEVCDGMAVGLGSGTTAAEAIAELGCRVREGLDIAVFASSEDTARLAVAAGLRPRSFEETASLDLTIDGVDEIDPALRAIKGGGGALLREKILASAATRMIAIADLRKRVAKLGGVPLPVEVLPFARSFVTDRIGDLGGEPVWRQKGGCAAITDQGNHILDCRFAPMGDLCELAANLSAIPGVMEHGLFLAEIDALYIAGVDGVQRVERRTGANGATELA